MESSARLLRLLGLLQGGRSATGRDLAARLGVTVRTVRRDVDKLRELGYRVESRLGVDGGYCLDQRATLPPLLLDDADALALVVSLRTAAALGLAGMDKAALQALNKVEHLLPPRTGAVARAVARAVSAPGAHGPQVAVEVLTGVATAIRDHLAAPADLRRPRWDGVPPQRRAPPDRPFRDSLVPARFRRRPRGLADAAPRQDGAACPGRAVVPAPAAACG